MPLNIECSVVSCYCMCAGTPVPESEVFLARLHRARWDGTPAGNARVLTPQTFTHRVISVQLHACKEWNPQTLRSAVSFKRAELRCSQYPTAGTQLQSSNSGTKREKELHLHLGNGVFPKWSNLFCTRNILKKQLCSLTSLIHKRSTRDKKMHYYQHYQIRGYFIKPKDSLLS